MLTETFTQTLVAYHPLDAARILERHEVQEVVSFLGSLEQELQPEIVENFSEAFAAQVLLRLPLEDRQWLFKHLTKEIAADILEHIPEGEAADLLGVLTESHAETVETLSLALEDSAASIMSPDFVAFSETSTIAQTLLRLRRQAAVGRNVSYVYVINDEGQLVGVLLMRDLVLNEATTKLKDIMLQRIVAVYADDDLGAVADILQEQKLLAVPVLDDYDRLVGVLSATQLVGELQEEGFEDAQKMFGAGEDEHATSSSLFAVRQRMPWLQVNLLTAFLAAAVVGAFDQVIAQATILAAFLPVVAGQSGNAGAQALAVMLRSLALSEIDIKRPRKVLIKEAKTGLINGLATGVVAAVIALVASQRPALALLIFAAMVFNLVVAGVTGALIPMLMQALGQDPAQSSNILLTTVTDIVGFASFLGLAVLALPYL